MKNCSRVVHVGANVGQERNHYDNMGVSVLWVEPIDAIYELLCANIEKYPKQRAIKALLTDRPGQKITFNIAGNEGNFSSIYPLLDHKLLWPDIDYVDRVELISDTLDNVMANERPADVLFMDTQGSELLVLRGAEETLKSVKYIYTEASDFEAYEGGCTLEDIEKHLGERGFVEVAREKFAGNEKVGHCFNITYKRID